MRFGSAPSAWLHHRCWRSWYDKRCNQAVAAVAEMVPDLRTDLQRKVGTCVSGRSVEEER